MQAESLALLLEAVESQMLESTIQDDLSISEIVSLYMIDRLQEPTIVEFANRIRISQSNATYIIRKLINKGYLVKKQQSHDKREYHLITTEKFSGHIDYVNSMIPHIVEDVLPQIKSQDQCEMEHMLTRLTDIQDLNKKPAV